MLIKQDVIMEQLYSIKQGCERLFIILCIGFIYLPSSALHGEEDTNKVCKTLEASINPELLTEKLKLSFVYYLYIADFIESFIAIPTSNVTNPSSTISSTYLAGRAPIYDIFNKKAGTCSASFLCMQNQDGIFTDISNYLTADNGLIVSWLTPTTLINLELDSIVHSMVTECIVKAATKIGINPFYGQTYDLVVSSDDEKIYFKFYSQPGFLDR